MTKLLGRNNLNKLETRGVGSIADPGGGDPAPTLGEKPDSDSGGVGSDPIGVNSEPTLQKKPDPDPAVKRNLAPTPE